jgi:hypothetical protein
LACYTHNVKMISCALKWIISKKMGRLSEIKGNPFYIMIWKINNWWKRSQKWLWKRKALVEKLLNAMQTESTIIYTKPSSPTCFITTLSLGIRCCGQTESRRH